MKPHVSIQPAKKAAIAKILDNPVYMPDSGLIKRLATALARSSVSDLHNLELVISLRITQAVDDALANAVPNANGREE
jgi:hypothetical protein